MKKNKLMMATMAAAALLSSVGAVADNADSFVASYVVNDDITINGLEDVALTSADVVAVDGYVRGSTPFCVGRTDAEVENPLNFTVTVTSDNNYELINGSDEAIAYELHHTVADTFDRNDPIVAGDNTILGDTELNVVQCDNDGTGTGYMWVSVPPASQVEATTGTYDDTITLTVAPRS